MSPQVPAMLLVGLAEPVGRLLRAAGLLGSDLDSQLRLLRPGTSPTEFVERQLLLGVGAALGLATLALIASQSAVTAIALGLLAGGLGFAWPSLYVTEHGHARTIGHLPGWKHLYRRPGRVPGAGQRRCWQYARHCHSPAPQRRAADLRSVRFPQQRVRPDG